MHRIRISLLFITDLLYSMKGTLANMIELGGRNTEKDIWGHWGGYPVILSKNTYQHPCQNCGQGIVRETYLGGTIYYCPGVSAIGNIKIFNFGLWKKQYQLIPVSVSAAENV